MQNEIDLWFTDPTAIAPAVLDAYRELLTEEERARWARFHFDRHRQSYLATRALVRTVLSQRVGLPPHALRFGENGYGRPYLLQYPELSFNLSHTAGMIVLAMHGEGEVGVDIENLHTKRATQNLADYCFAPLEVAALRMAQPARRDETFFHFWTLKEAYIKARGMGLSLPLDSFAFDLADAGRIGFQPPPDRPADTSAYFCLMQPAPTHLCAVCSLKGNAAAVPKARWVTPLVSETAFDPLVLRWPVSAPLPDAQRHAP
jgi:4'-phosphopantetheinyl transferase